MMNIKDWFLQKTDSEQKILLGLLAFSLLALVYAFLYLPISRENQRLKIQNAVIEAEIAEMQGLEQQLKASKVTTGTQQQKVKLESSQIMMLIEKTAKQQAFQPRIQSQGESKIVVSLNKVDFNAAIRWLEILRTGHQLSIDFFSAEAKDKGIVNLKVVINH